MKGDEGKRAGPQDPVDLIEGARQLAGIEMDDRVERNYRCELTVCRWKLQKVSLAELHLRIFPAANGDHSRRQVDTDRGHATAGQPGCDVPGAAPQVGD